MGLKSPVLQFEKHCTQNSYFLQKLDFCIFEPKNCKMIENSSNAPLNFSPPKCNIRAKNHFNIIRAKSEKKKLKSGYLELRFSVVRWVIKNINSL